MNKGAFFLKCVLVGVIAIAFFGFVTMALWNWLVPEIFNGPAITYWQALGLLVLTKILFWGLGGKRHGPGAHMQWKRGLYEKFSDMTPEQREAFKNKMKAKWCHRSAPEDVKDAQKEAGH